MVQPNATAGWQPGPNQKCQNSKSKKGGRGEAVTIASPKLGRGRRGNPPGTRRSNLRIGPKNNRSMCPKGQPKSPVTGERKGSSKGTSYWKPNIAVDFMFPFKHSPRSECVEAARQNAPVEHHFSRFYWGNQQNRVPSKNNTQMNQS